MKVYLDNARSTRMAPEVFEAMKPWLTEMYYSPAAIYTGALEADEVMRKGQETIAGAIGATADEIVFTSGGTEANNLAIIGTAMANRRKGKHIVVSEIEHPSVLKTVAFLEKEGWEITKIGVDSHGFVDTERVMESIRDDTVLVSIMAVNDVIGTIEPIADIGKMISELENPPYFHVDAVEAFTKIPLDVNRMNVDLMSFSARKIHGPRGIGALYIRKGTHIEPIMHGGMVVNSMRPAIEDIPGIAGFSRAVELGLNDMDRVWERVKGLQKKLHDGIVESIDGTSLNGPPVGHEGRSAYNLNMTFDLVEGESITLMLDMEGIAVATGSACASQILKPNYVILALGKRPEDAHGSIRFTFSRYSTESDVDYVLEKLPEVIEKLRSISSARLGGR